MCPNTQKTKVRESFTRFGKENELKGKCENSTKKGFKSYIQALYIRADYLTNLVPATKFAHLDVTTVLLKGLVAIRYLQQ